LLSPFTLAISLNFNKGFKDPAVDPFKYQANVILTPIALKMNPLVIADLFRFQAYCEMFTY